MSAGNLGKKKYRRKRLKLMYLWLVSSLLLLILLFAQTVAFGAGPLSLRSWSWFFSTIFPFTAFVVALVKPKSLLVKGRETSYRIAWGTSLFYVGLVLFSFVVVSVLRYSDAGWYDISYFWLAPVQAIVLYAVGLVSVSEDEDASEGEMA